MSETINIKKLANDIRWRFISRLGELIAILADIEDKKNFINTHAVRANPLDVAVNLHRIHEEAAAMEKDIKKFKDFLHHFQNVTIREIYSDWEDRTDEEVATNKNNNQNGNRPGRVVSRKKPRRVRRLRPKFRGGQKARAKQRANGQKARVKQRANG